MKVTTTVTVDFKDDKGRRNLAPGEHSLPDAIAKELIDRGFAKVAGKGAQAEASNPTPEQFDTSLLEGTVPDIAAALQKGELTSDHLKALKKAEKAGGSPRVGVIDAIDAAFKALAAK